MFDVSDPRRPREVARLETPETVGAVALAGARGWVELGIRFKQLETAPGSVDQEWLRRGWLRTGAESWNEGAFVGVGNVVSLDLADPARPRVAGGVDLTPPDTLAMRSPRLLLAGGRLYVTDHPMGLYVLDVADADRPRRLGELERGVRFALAAPRLYVADGADYTVSGSSGTHAFPGGFAVIDVSDPAAPREVGRIHAQAGRRDGANVHVVAANGRYAYLGFSILRRNLAVEEYLAVVDVADPAKLRVVERRRVRGGIGELLIEAPRSRARRQRPRHRHRLRPGRSRPAARAPAHPPAARWRRRRPRARRRPRTALRRRLGGVGDRRSRCDAMKGIAALVGGRGRPGTSSILDQAGLKEVRACAASRCPKPRRWPSTSSFLPSWGALSAGDAVERADRGRVLVVGVVLLFVAALGEE